MAKSGSFSKTFSTGYTLKVAWKESDVDTANNQSDITCTVTLSATGSYYINSSASKDISLTINGTKYTATCAVGISAGGSKTLMTKTVSNINHSSDGSKTVAISCTLGIEVTLNGNFVSSVSVSGNASLTTIARKSSLSASNGTLSTAQTLTVTRQSSSFTHTITYKCGSASGTICTKSSSTSISWTPPISLAAQNTTGTSVSITFTITTYNGDTSLGSNTKTISCAIPSSVAPTCTITVEDTAGYSGTYGWLKGLSKIKYTVTATKAQGSDIASYSVTANGSTYTTSTGTTGVLASTGTLTVKVTVKDKRGRSGTASTSITVVNYEPPKVTALTVLRCNSNGTENMHGAYVKATFSASVTSLSSKNTAKYVMHYRVSSSSEYSTKEFTDIANTYTVTNKSFIFAADTGKSYTISVDAIDAFGSSRKTTQSSTAFALMHFAKDGMGLALGKVVELASTFEVALKTKFYKEAILSGGSYVHTARGTPGTQGYVKVAQIVITATYRNASIIMHVLQRGRPESILSIRFDNANGTDPGIQSFTYVGNIGAYLVKSATSTWGVYIKKAEGYDSICVSQFYNHSYNIDGMTITWTDEHADNLPSGYITSSLYMENDSGWITVSSFFNGITQATGSSWYTKVQYRKIKNHVYVKGHVTIPSAWAGHDNWNIFTLPVGYRPATRIYVLNTLTGKNVARVIFDTDGRVILEWVASIADGSYVSGGLSWVQITGDFLID